MSFEGLIHIKSAISALNPREVREMSEHPLRVSLHAPNPAAFERLEDFFLRGLTPERRIESAAALSRAPGAGLGQPSLGQSPAPDTRVSPARFDLAVYD